MDVLNAVLPVLLYIFGIILLIVLIILGIRMIQILDKADKMLDDANEILENVSEKANPSLISSTLRLNSSFTSSISIILIWATKSLILAFKAALVSLPFLGANKIPSPAPIADPAKNLPNQDFFSLQI